MAYTKVANQIIMLFLILFVGYIARKKNILTDESNRILSELLLNVSFPLMIIASFNYSFSKDMLYTAEKLFILSLIIHLCLILLTRIFYHKYKHESKSVLRFISIFSNCAFMGYPIIQSIYGNVGVFYTAIFNIPFNILMWTAGIILFTGERDIKSIKKIALNPGILSVFIGLIIFLFSIKLPQPIFKAMDMIGSTTVPLSMIITGSTLAGMNIKEVFSGFTVYYASAIRLIVIPAIVFVVLKAVGLSGMLLVIPVVIMGMPASANTSIMAEKYNADAALASRCIFITTTLSVITIPLIVKFI